MTSVNSTAPAPQPAVQPKPSKNDGPTNLELSSNIVDNGDKTDLKALNKRTLENVQWQLQSHNGDLAARGAECHVGDSPQKTQKALNVLRQLRAESVNPAPQKMPATKSANPAKPTLSAPKSNGVHVGAQTRNKNVESADPLKGSLGLADRLRAGPTVSGVTVDPVTQKTSTAADEARKTALLAPLQAANKKIGELDNRAASLQKQISKASPEQQQTLLAQVHQLRDGADQLRIARDGYIHTAQNSANNTGLDLSAYRL